MSQKHLTKLVAFLYSYLYRLLDKQQISREMSGTVTA
jgi:hypothetical protein